MFYELILYAVKDRYGGKADEEELASSSTSESEDEDAKVKSSN